MDCLLPAFDSSCGHPVSLCVVLPPPPPGQAVDRPIPELNAADQHPSCHRTYGGVSPFMQRTLLMAHGTSNAVLGHQTPRGWPRHYRFRGQFRTAGRRLDYRKAQPAASTCATQWTGRLTSSTTAPWGSTGSSSSLRGSSTVPGQLGRKWARVGGEGGRCFLCR